MRDSIYPQLLENRLLVWRFSIPPLSSIEFFITSFLNRDEKERADLFYFEKDRGCYIFCRGLLRIMIGKCLGLDPSSITFSYASYGKPFINGNALNFNLSHSASHAAFVFSLKTAVGIDIETPRPLSFESSIVANYFSPAEREYITQAGDQRAFFRCWTRKEALLKALGIGIGSGLHRLKQISCLNEVVEIETSEGNGIWKNWRVETLDVTSQYAWGLAYEGEPKEITINEHDSWENFI